MEVHEQLGGLPDWLRIFQDVRLGAGGIECPVQFELTEHEPETCTMVVADGL
jgi:hypothetical protein